MRRRRCCSGSGTIRRWQTALAVAPDRAHWGAGHGRAAWRACRKAAATSAPACSASSIAAHAGPVVIIGTDMPGIRPAHIAEAFRLLGRHDAVFGPATDGGYWLVGLRRRPRVLRPFAGVRWSSPHALADTLANLEGRAVAFVATLSDVDDAGDLRAWRTAVGRRVLPVPSPRLRERVRVGAGSAQRRCSSPPIP